MADIFDPPDTPVSLRDTTQAESAEPHMHDYVEIVMVWQGRGIHRLHAPDGSVLANAVIKGDIFTVQPGEVHSYAQCRNYRIYNLCVSPKFLAERRKMLSSLEFFDSFLRLDRPFRLNQLHLPPIGFGDAETRLSRLRAVLHSTRPSRSAAVEVALMDFLLTVFDGGVKLWTFSRTEIDEPLFRSIAELEARPEQKFELPSAARDAGMSLSGYAHKFKRLVGMSPRDYSLLLRLDKARRMLENTRLSCEEIAQRTGVYDANYLVRAFKKRFGITPLRYRSRLICHD